MGSMRVFVFYWQLLARFSSFQYWVPCGDFGLWLQKLCKLQNAVKEAEGSAKRERILHAASSASSPARAADAAEARKRGRGRQVFTLKLCWLSRLVIILSISRLFFSAGRVGRTLENDQGFSCFLVFPFRAIALFGHEIQGVGVFYLVSEDHVLLLRLFYFIIFIYLIFIAYFIFQYFICYKYFKMFILSSKDI